MARAADVDPDVRRRALGQLLSRYTPAFVTYLRSHRRLPHDRAEDLVGGFVCDQVVAKGLVRRADRSRGRFRSFMLKALERYVRRVHRHEHADKRAPATGIVALPRVHAIFGSAEDAQRGFDLAWAREVLFRAAERMRDECRKAGRAVTWEVFECRVLAPALDGVPPTPYEQLVQRFHLESPAQAGNVMITGKRMYQRALRAVVAEYVGDDADLDAEIRHLWGIFTRRKDGRLR